MEVHPRTSSAMAKWLWNLVRIAIYMMRKGLISKRKVIMDMNMTMERGKVLGKKTLANLLHHHHHPKAPTRGYGLREYEFSCSNSPNPFSYPIGKRKLHYHFPCINVQDEPDEEPAAPPGEAMAVAPLPKLRYSSPLLSPFNFRLDTAAEMAPGEKLSPVLSPFSVRVSNFSSVEEVDSGRPQVDAEAEEFIKRFYEQLRLQSRTALLQC